MNKISNSIADYYQLNFANLAAEKQLHFASRTYLWLGTPESAEYIARVRQQFIPNDDPAMLIHFTRLQTKKQPLYGVTLAAETRQQYFAKYPELRAAGVALYRLLLAYSLYGIDGRQAFSEAFDTAAIDQLAYDLQNDRPALKNLSTFAINFLYLYRYFLRQNDSTIPVNLQTYSDDVWQQQLDKTELKLLLYFYTHCVIGESLFYARPLSVERSQQYVDYTQKLDTIIADNFNHISLDNKFEYLVTTRLVNYSSSLEARIWEEAELSLSARGDYVIDRHNDYAGALADNISSAEHRNVLLIMAAARPAGTLDK